MGSIGGPISKKASFFFDGQRRNIDEVAIINATVLNQNPDPACTDPSCLGLPYTAAVPNPHTRTNVGTRIDYQISKNNTLTGHNPDQGCTGSRGIRRTCWHSRSS